MLRSFLICATTTLLLEARGSAQAPEGPPPANDTSPADFEPPEVLEHAQAPFPEAAVAAGIQSAEVVLEILVDPTGRSGDVRVVTGAGHGFDEAAAEAARRFVWKPGRAAGKEVAVRVTYTYRFARTPGNDVQPAGREAGKLPARGTAVLKGLVRQRGTRAALVGAGVAASLLDGDAASFQAEAVTDLDGRFVLADLPAGRYRIAVLAPGHRRGDFSESLAESQVLGVNYYLESESENPYATVVEGAPLREETERHSVSIEEATHIAGTRGDALRAVENMPGVARPPFLLGIMIVRGSNPEDTQALVDGHFVPLVYHFGGITSIVNADLLGSIEFLPGNFSARYGRAIGGIVEVEMRSPAKKRLTGYVDASLLDAGFLLEGPVGRGGWALAARRSFADFVIDAVVPDDSGAAFTTAPRYWDYQALFTYPLGGGRLDVTAFGSNDRLVLILDDPADFDPGIRGSIGTNTYFQRLQARYRRPLGPATDLSLSVSQGVNSAKFTAGTALDFDVLAWVNSYRAEVIHRPFKSVRLLAGTDGLYYPLHVQAHGPRPPQEGEVPRPPAALDSLMIDRDGYEWRHGVYLESAIDLGRGFTVTPGARADYYRLSDSFAVDPRLTARWHCGPDTVRGGLGRFTEPPQEFESDPTFGNPDVNPEHAVHASIGYDRQLTSALRVETTFFYKWLSDLIVKDAALEAQPDGSLRALGYSNDGVGRVVGGELLLRHELRKGFFGWVSYTLSRSERRDHPDEDYRLFSLDQTHILTLVGSWRLPWRLNGGIRFRYVTGSPSTPVVGSIYDADADVYLPLPGAINSERLPAYHELDLRLERQFVFDTWRLTAYLDVQNVYNRRNPELYQYSYDYRERTIISGLPIFPALGVKGEF